MKTDKRDAHRLAYLYRVGELTVVHISTPGEEAIRNLARQRADLVLDRTRARHHLSKLLLTAQETVATAIARELLGFVMAEMAARGDRHRPARQLPGGEISELSTIRRDAAAAGKIPVTPMPTRTWGDEVVKGYFNKSISRVA